MKIRIPKYIDRKMTANNTKVDQNQRGDTPTHNNVVHQTPDPSVHLGITFVLHAYYFLVINMMLWFTDFHERYRCLFTIAGENDNIVFV